MKINWKVRIKNPWFWIGMIALIISAVGLSPEMFTSWEIVWAEVKGILMNPFKIGCIVIALLGYVQDPTTQGIGDGEIGLSYTKPGVKAE